MKDIVSFQLERYCFYKGVVYHRHDLLPEVLQLIATDSFYATRQCGMGIWCPL